MEFNNNITLLITANTANERILKHIRILPATEIDLYKIARVKISFLIIRQLQTLQADTNVL